MKNRMRLVIILIVIAFCLVRHSAHSQDQSKSSPPRSPVSQLVSGPSHSLNTAIAAGSGATLIFQPVPPKTVPASSYPMGTTIVGQTITLGSVPARVWIEAQITGWAPEVLKITQFAIDATDVDGDGGGVLGANADCAGVPAVGAGDLSPALIPCSSNLDCRAAAAGRTGPCAFAEPCRCISRPSYYPPGGNICEWVFFDRCDPEYFGQCCSHVASIDLSVPNVRGGWVFEPGEGAEDFFPSYTGTVILDVPASAKGRYLIDLNESMTYMANHDSPPDNQIPIAAIHVAVIEVECGACCRPFEGCTDSVRAIECDPFPIGEFHPGSTCAEIDCCECASAADCDDGDLCTEDICTNCVCSNPPDQDWNQATECCNPATGSQAPIPASSSCSTGGCSQGGNLGFPMQWPRPNGTPCVHDDPCYENGVCHSGACMSSQYAGSDCPKSRFISFEPGPSDIPRAFRVRLVSLHHPNPPYSGAPVADFSAYEGESRWLGAPSTFAESSANPASVHVAFLGCTPEYVDWNAIDLLHVTGAEIVPSSVFEVQSIPLGLDINVESNYSTPITLVTGRWADVVIPHAPPSTTAQPNAGDMSAMLDKFKSTSTSISKPRALLTGTGMGGIPNPAQDVSFTDVAATVDGHNGKGYPYAGPQPCP